MTDSIAGPSTITATGKGVRTKLGCFTCRARKVKCDLTRPSCQTCTRLSLECTYVKPEGQMNIPRLRRGRKRRRSDPVEHHQSSSSTASWADRFGEEINGNGNSMELSDVQQLRRASTNTMPELWRYNNNNFFPGSGSGSGSGDDLASSVYLNSLMRRESMPIPIRGGGGGGGGGGGLGDILDPSMRTSSPAAYSNYQQLDQLRRSMTPQSQTQNQNQNQNQHWQPTSSLTPELHPYHHPGSLPPGLPSISHTSSPLNWHTPQLPSGPMPSFDPLHSYAPNSGDLHPVSVNQSLPSYLPDPNWDPRASLPNVMPSVPGSGSVSPLPPLQHQHTNYAYPAPGGGVNTIATLPPQARGRDDGLPPWLNYDIRQ